MFDLKTHEVDKNTGKIISENLYTMKCEQGKPTIFIRKGKKYTEAGDYIGDVEQTPVAQVEKPVSKVEIRK